MQSIIQAKCGYDPKGNFENRRSVDMFLTAIFENKPEEKTTLIILASCHLEGHNRSSHNNADKKSRCLVSEFCGKSAVCQKT